MNRLKELRTKANLTLRELESYVKIRNSTLCGIENGKQPFREIHVQKLTSFFDVTSDYLIGYSPAGIGLHFDDEHAYVSEAELARIRESHNVSCNVIRRINPETWTITTPSQTTVAYSGEYSVHRSVGIPIDQTNVSECLREQVKDELNSLGAKELEKVLRFIKDYIK